jgi:raffinose/stachyose/melibiose transport system permease protein
MSEVSARGSATAADPLRPMTEAQRRAPARRRIRRGLGRLGICLLVAIELYPLVWLLLQSFKSTAEFNSSPAWSLPSSLYLHNWAAAWQGHIGTYFKNSLIAVFPSLAMIIVLSAGAAFAIEIMRWRGRNLTLLVFIAGILIPLQMILLPLFTVYFHLGLIDSLWGLIIAYTGTGLPLGVFLMAGYFRVVPRELLEAATLDGASIYQTFTHVVLPVVLNATLTVAVVEFFFIWNDLLLSLTFISSDSKRTIQPGLLNFATNFGQVNWGPTFAAISMTVLPTLALYLILNKRVMRGLTAGSVKG